MAQRNCQEETTNSENPLQGGTNSQGAKTPEETTSEISRSPNRQTKQKMTQKPAMKFLSIEGNSIYRRHIELRVQLYVPTVETFPIPLRYIDVIRRTNTTLDVLLGCLLTTFGPSMWIEVCQTQKQNSRSLHCCMNIWSGERLTKIQATTRVDHLWPEMCSTCPEAAQKKEKGSMGCQKQSSTVLGN